MDFALSQDQSLLKDSAKNFVKKESPPSRLRSLREDSLGYSQTLWKQMGELGWLALLFPESIGGYDGSFVDAAILLEQFGSTLLPEPFIPSVVLGGMAILQAGNQEQQKIWLSPLLSGETTLALAYAEEESRFDPFFQKTKATKAGSSYRINGRKSFVLNGHGANTIVVSARTANEFGDPKGISLFVLTPDTPGLKIQSIQTMDGHRAAMITLNDVEVPQAQRLGEEGGAGEILAHVLDLGAVAACAEGVGIMQTVLAMTISYLKTREQFGVKIGAFQALQHRTVDMFVETELAKSTSILASLKAQEKDVTERKSAISAAKVQLALSGRFVTQQSIQLHGGIGTTDEHDIGLYFKRMHILNTLFGDEVYHTTRFSSLPSFTHEI